MLLRIFDRNDAGELLRRKPLDEFPVSATMQARTLATFGEALTPDKIMRRILRDVRDFEGCLSPLQECVHRDHIAGR